MSALACLRTVWRILVALPVIRRLRGRLQLHVDLVQQILGLLGVTTQIKFICGLSGRDSFPRLVCQALGRGEIRMTGGADIPYRRIRIGHCTSDSGNDNQSGKSKLLHDGPLLSGCAR